MVFLCLRKFRKHFAVYSDRKGLEFFPISAENNEQQLVPSTRAFRGSTKTSPKTRQGREWWRKGKAGGCSRSPNVKPEVGEDRGVPQGGKWGWEFRLQEQEVLNSHEEPGALPERLHQQSKICLPPAFDLLIFLSLCLFNAVCSHFNYVISLSVHHGEYCTRLSKQLLSLSACHLLFIMPDNNLPHILREDRMWLFWKWGGRGEKSTLHYPRPCSICNVTSVSTISNIFPCCGPGRIISVGFFVPAAISSFSPF